MLEFILKTLGTAAVGVLAEKVKKKTGELLGLDDSESRLRAEQRERERLERELLEIERERRERERERLEREALKKKEEVERLNLIRNISVFIIIFCVIFYIAYSNS